MKLGDIVENGWAGSRNPQKVEMVIRITRKRIHVLSRAGEVSYFNRDGNRLSVVDRLDLGPWDAAIDDAKGGE